MTKRWDSKASEEIEDQRIDAFIAEVIAVCKRHGFSIAHEDSQGGFLIERFDEDNAKWLMQAARNL